MATIRTDQTSRLALSRSTWVEAFVVVHGWTCAALALLVTLVISNLAGAQETASDETSGGADVDDPFSGVEEMLVVGSPQADLLTSSASSVTRFDADLLQAVGAEDISDLSQITPNLEIRTADATSPTFFIRGVGLSDFNANAGGSVAVYQDGVPMNSPALQLGQLFDVQGVEVLRGPQGSGRGRNASAGAIKVTSKKPTGEHAATLSATYGNYDALDLEGAVDVPILADLLAARFSFRLTERAGWGENGCANLPSLAERDANAAALDRVRNCGEIPDRPWPAPPAPRQFVLSSVPGGLEKNVNDIGTWAARGMFHFRPESNETDWLLIVRGRRTDQLSTLGQAVGTSPLFGAGETDSGYVDSDIQEMQQAIARSCRAAGGTRCGRQAREALQSIIAEDLDIRPERGDYNRVGPTKHDTWGGSLEGEIPVADLVITTISAYDGYDRFRDQDNDFTSIDSFESVTNDDAWQFFQEINIASEGDSFIWEAGGYYLTEQLDSESQFIEFDRESGQKYHQDTHSFAFHAGFTWEIREEFTLEAGARYNWEQKEFEFGFRGPFASRSFKDHAVWQEPTGTVSLIYTPTEDLRFYWKYARGWKGGQFNASASQLTNVEPAEPESIDSFEVGMNGYMLDGRLGLAASLFYYKFDGYQVFITEDNLGSFPQTQIINANEAELYGAEVEVRLQPLLALVPEEVENLSFDLRFGWNESEFLDFTNTVIRAIAPGPLRPPEFFPVTADLSGNQLINAPRFKVNMSAAWEFNLGRLGTITPRYDGSWSDDVFFGPNEGRGSLNALGEPGLPEFGVGQPANWVHNFSVRYSPTESGTLEFLGWVRNMTNERYKDFAFDGSTFAGQTVNFIAEPRTYGGTVTVSF